MTPRTPSRRFVRLARIAGVNAALILAGFALVALAGEAYLRLSGGFVASALPLRFVPEVGLLFEPHAEVRYTNGLDYWTVQRANSLGFLDREPPSPARAAASCHVAVIGDSFVEALEVPIADKLPVRLEALAAAVLPEWDVTASAWGRRGTGSANQLPYYDEYVRTLRPNLVVLVFVGNDFADNSPAVTALGWRQGGDPARMPYAYPERAGDGGIRLRPPHPRPSRESQWWELHDLQPVSEPWYEALGRDGLPWWELHLQPGSERWYEALGRGLAERSLFARWLEGKRRVLIPRDPLPSIEERAALLASRPGYGWVLDGWDPPSGPIDERLLEEDPPPVFAEAFEFTAWSLAEFRRRADRDGAALAILSTHQMGGVDSRWSELLRGMAAPLGIPVISQYDWIAGRGGRVGDAHWPHDDHWNAQGHQWAAEAILDWLRRHPEVCGDRA